MTAMPGVSADHVALIAALRRLPYGQRAAVALHYLADLPVAEVAETLQVSVGTVKSRLSRGRAALAALLGDTGVGDRVPPSLTTGVTWQVRAGAGLGIRGAAGG